MPITTLSEVTAFLQLTTSAHDTIISLLIPEVQERVAEICNTVFSTGIYVQGGCTWDTTDNLVSMSAATFLANGFATDDDIYISGSYRNNGYHRVLSAAAGVLEIVSATTVVDELSGATVLIEVCKWPKGIKPIVAGMIKYDYEMRPGLQGLTSERIGDYSASWDAGAQNHGYPPDVVKGLAHYSRQRFW